MFIKRIDTQIRNDLYGVLQCEGCGMEEKLSGGYDDDNWHSNVLPARKCKSCGLSRKDVLAKVSSDAS